MMMKSQTLTSRERVRRSLMHQQPDRIPIDFGGHRSSGIAATNYARLKKALGIATGAVYVHDMMQQLAIVEPVVLDAVGADVIELGRAFMLDANDWKDWILPDGTPCKIPAYVNVEKRGSASYLLSDDGVDLAVQPAGCGYFEQIHWPWIQRNPDEQGFSDLEEAFPHIMWSAFPSPGGHIPLTPQGCAQLAAGARELRESTERAILGIFGGNLFEIPHYLYRMDNYLLYMRLYPEACERLSQALCDFYLPRSKDGSGPSVPISTLSSSAMIWAPRAAHSCRPRCTGAITNPSSGRCGTW